MKINIVKPFGFCAGVKRAIQLVEEALRKYNHVYCLGKLIHNEHVIEELESRGLIVINDLSKIEVFPSAAIVIRTHGITPSEYEYLSNLNIDVIDATCPIVKKIQMLCHKFSREGYHIIIFGNRDHAEVKSLIGFSQGRATVINRLEDIDDISPDVRTILISQSTKYESELIEILKILRKKGLPEKNFYNTICNDIKSRQKRVNILAGRVDLVLILGSRTSANTNNLYAIACNRCRDTFFISTDRELPRDRIKSVEKIGVATGASTPYNFLHSILEKIKIFSERGERNAEEERKS